MLNQETRARLGGLHSARLLLWWADFAEMFGTRFTMEDGFWADRMGRHASRSSSPVHRIIFDELCCGIFSDDSRATLVEVIDTLAATGVGAVVLGCTQIELLVSREDTTVPVLPSTALHVASAVQAAFR